MAIKIKIDKAKQNNLDRVNPSRQNRVFEVGEKVHLRNNKRLGNNLTPLYSEERVEADLATKLPTKHKHRGHFGSKPHTCIRSNFDSIPLGQHNYK